MPDDLRVVFESRNLAACSDRSLVLSAAGIPHQIVQDAGGCALLVAADRSAEAVQELQLFDEENPPVVKKPPRTLPYQDAMPGIAAYIVIVCFVAWLAGVTAMGENWLAAGRVDGELIRDGQWWRLFTALTLHAGLSHLAGNLVFGSFFGFFAGRLLGPGVAWLTILLAAGTGNLLNTMLLESAHRSIGASTAVFAALGLLAGFVWRAKLMSQERWSYRVGPIVGGLALLMFTGTGDANTDIGAHLMGFVSGFGGGLLLVRFIDDLQSRRLQLICGGSAFLLLLIAWQSALLNSPVAAIM
ncbi:MAG: rhomboid family intramembrane serine protease [Woeseiaceae bacterium]|nr:rhomboid family intramembrane serine protease [Woeseiaceae bacterium]